MDLQRRTLLTRAAAAFGISVLPACDPPRKLWDSGDTAGGAPLAGETLDGTQCTLTRVTSNEEFYITSYRGSWAVEAESWALTIDGLVSSPVRLDHPALQALPGREREHTLVCVSAGPSYPAISNTIWTGLPLAEVLSQLGVTVDSAARYLHLFGADGYQTQIPVTDLDDREIWLVWQMNGEPLPEAHGYPARLLVPGRYGMKNPKWITGVRPSAEPLVGTWEASGWSDDCTVRPGAFLLWPGVLDTVRTGTVYLVGAAFCGEVPISRVEVQIDEGPWVEVELAHGGASVWTLWCHRWDAGLGDHTLRVRVTAADGQTSDPELDGSDRGGWGGILERNLTVE